MTDEQTAYKYRMVQGRKLYDIPDDVCQDLLAKARAALKQCYPKPGEGYAVALLTKKGSIYTGASYGSDTATLTMHSEAVALAHAAQHGETEIIAITGPNCHICKQLIWESSLRSGIEIQVIVQEGTKVKKVPITSLMPHPWPDAQGNK
ncbi:MAG TPA: hypothetical protein VJB96_00910 [Patescibacteria group bacterium]|nr:hypothetical protein [Patescibacteria group bacterium]